MQESYKQGLQISKEDAMNQLLTSDEQLTLQFSVMKPTALEENENISFYRTKCILVNNTKQTTNLITYFNTPFIKEYEQQQIINLANDVCSTFSNLTVNDIENKIHFTSTTYPRNIKVIDNDREYEAVCEVFCSVNQ